MLNLQLACTRIGAIHSVVFAGFSAEALAARLLDSRPVVVLTASAVMRGAKPIGLKVGTSSFCKIYFAVKLHRAWPSLTQNILLHD